MKPFLAKYTYNDREDNEFTSDCEIHRWCDKSDRFAIKYYNHFEGKYLYHWAPFEDVIGWTWPSLSQHFATHGWD